MPLRLGCHLSSTLSRDHTVWWFIRALPCKSRKSWCSDNWRIIATWIPKSLWNSFSVKSTFILGPEMLTGRKPSSFSDTGQSREKRWNKGLSKLKISKLKISQQQRHFRLVWTVNSRDSCSLMELKILSKNTGHEGLASSSGNELGGYDQPSRHFMCAVYFKCQMTDWPWCLRGLSALIWKICWANTELMWTFYFFQGFKMVTNISRIPKGISFLRKEILLLI